MDVSKILTQLDNHETVDYVLNNGPISSSSQIQRIEIDGNSAYWLMHGIDGTDNYFTRSALVEMLEGKRSHWDGDLDRTAEKTQDYCDRCSDTLSIQEIAHGEDVCFPCLKNEEE